MYRIHLARRALALLAWVVWASPGNAQASLYELSWAYRWGSGDIVFDGSVPDSNPAPNLGDYFGAIVSYDVTGWTTSLEPVRLVGHSGAISVQHRSLEVPQCADVPGFCPGAALTFELGTASPPYDPAGWHLAINAPWELGNFFDHLPTQPSPPGPCVPGQPESCPEFGRYSFVGSIRPNTPNGPSFFPLIDESVIVFLKALQAPVPETGTVSLFGIGLAMLMLTRRGRGHPASPS